ncbi:unnamed protein product [Cuscuta europaea]|uniref:DUF4283 domain-containing protein n=1 Tax=Cuscuta europaea TaxID=41803 RepID=A0A9P0ZGB9_CUSEU|nr:unnamed protein product [Cuscuta europaea]
MKLVPKPGAPAVQPTVKGPSASGLLVSDKALGTGAEKSSLDASKETEMVPKPWSTLFKDNRDPTHGLKLRFVQPKGNSLDFADRVLPSMVEMWGYCLVGFFTGKFPGLKAIHELKQKWGVRCLVRSHDKDWIIFKFQNEADRTQVLKEGPYTIFGKSLMLKVLSEDFSFEDKEFLKVPIWVKFPNLPMKLWNEDAMSEVASMVGVPFTTDKVTQERTNHKFARVLIEIDVSKPPTLSFPIRLPSRKVVKQFVVYETFPNFCFHCKEYGHHPFICKKLSKENLENDEKENKGEIEVENSTQQEKKAAAREGTLAPGANSTHDTADFEVTADAIDDIVAVLEEDSVAAVVQTALEATAEFKETISAFNEPAAVPSAQEATAAFKEPAATALKGVAAAVPNQAFKEGAAAAAFEEPAATIEAAACDEPAAEIELPTVFKEGVAAAAFEEPAAAIVAARAAGMGVTPTQVHEVEAVATAAPDQLLQPPKPLVSYTLRVRVGKDGKKRFFKNDVEISNNVLN